MHTREEDSGIVVAGAGPAGMMAAAAAARAGRRVVLCDQLEKAGAKLLATGGGRCNLTNTLPELEFIARFGRQGRFLLPCLEALSAGELLRFLEERGVPCASPDGFHLFPLSNRARDVRDALLAECESAGVESRLSSRVTALRIEERSVIGVELDSGFMPAGRVILATGGKSYPQLGATGSGYALAAQAGHRVVEPVPALAALHLAEVWPAACAGVVLQRARLWIDLPRRRDEAEEGEILFTHLGISGPAALNLSGAAARLLREQPRVPLRLNPCLPEREADWRARFAAWRDQEGAKSLLSLLDRHLPRSLAAALLSACKIEPALQAAHLPAGPGETLARCLAGIPLTAIGTGDFNEAMVTRGGVALKEVDPRTLQSRLVQGLYFAGEILDLDGPCGGFNLQWAFSSGRLAGSAAAR